MINTILDESCIYNMMILCYVLGGVSMRAYARSDSILTNVEQEKHDIKDGNKLFTNLDQHIIR